jgi:hypothetical protein
MLCEAGTSQKPRRQDPRVQQDLAEEDGGSSYLVKHQLKQPTCASNVRTAGWVYTRTGCRVAGTSQLETALVCCCTVSQSRSPMLSPESG